MLYSGGKDSSVLLHLARKAFYPARPPFPFLHIATGWDFRELLEHRDRMAAAYDLDLLVHGNDDGDARRHQSVHHRDRRVFAPDADRGADARRSTATASTWRSAAAGATRRSRAPRSASSRGAQPATPGTRATSSPSCGAPSTSGWRRAKPCAPSRCRIGPRPTSGPTSRPRASRSCRSTSPPSARCCAAACAGSPSTTIACGSAPTTRSRPASVRFRTLGCWPLTGAIELAGDGRCVHHRRAPQRAAERAPGPPGRRRAPRLDGAQEARRLLLTWMASSISEACCASSPAARSTTASRP